MGLFRRRARRRELRIFFATDVHGSDVCFRKFLNAAGVYEADVLILGGDIAGKRLSPVVDHGGGRYVGVLGGQEIELSGEAELRAFEKRAADAGLYTHVAPAEELERLGHDEAAVEALLTRLMVERVERWMELAAERLSDWPGRLIVNCGNDDPFELDAPIEASPVATFAEGKLVQLDERRWLTSVGFANETPWHCARDVPEEELRERIARAVSGWDESRGSLVFNFHCPPHGSGLDTATQLNLDLSPVTQGGQPISGPVGSRAVREAIETYHPVLSLHGHIHESRGATRINGTLVINPGSEYPEGILRGALVDLDAHGVHSHVLTAG